MSENNNDIRKVMIIQDGCGYCEQAQEILKNEIASGKIELLNTNTPDGERIAEALGVDSTPTMIVGNDQFAKKCALSKDASKAFCDDGSVIDLKE